MKAEEDLKKRRKDGRKVQNEFFFLIRLDLVFCQCMFVQSSFTFPSATYIMYVAGFPLNVVFFFHSLLIYN